MKILVCGGRDYGDLRLQGRKAHPFWQFRLKQYHHILGTLDRIAQQFSVYYNPHDNWLPADIQIIAGGARGADSVAVQWAICNWTRFYQFPANWQKHGKAAGYIRNKQMLDEGKPDLVVAFPGGRGTGHMVSLSRKYGVPVRIINEDSTL